MDPLIHSPLSFTKYSNCLLLGRKAQFGISCAEDQGLCRWKCRKPENELNYYCENRKKCCMIGFPTAISQTTEASKIETTSCPGSTNQPSAAG
uniref:Beta-defensin n=1 Tax=Marmota marmota marmota TaxID=9994 RepID=A0A8C6AD02_MARMA